MDSRREYLNTSMPKIIGYIENSEAMKMILSSESPDTEDLEDQG